jgi:HAD superfamily hydrolase (TIGR01509 family)
MRTKAKIQNIVFDLGRVLVDFDHRKGCAQVSEVTGIPADILWKRFFDDSLEHQFEAGEVTVEDVMGELAKMAGQNIDQNAVWHAAGNIFEEITGMHQLVRKVKDQVEKVGLLSNTNIIHWKYVVENFPVAGEFDLPILSFEVGCMKPNLEIYQRASEILDITPSETIFVDDLAANIAGARSAGWHGIVFTGHDALIEELKSYGVNITSD